MSTNDILRRYLDILNEDEQPTPAMPSPDGQVTYAPQSGTGSISDVMEAVKAFQKSVGLEETGLLDPKTLAEILAQSGRLGKEEAAKLNAGAQSAEPKPEEMAEGMGTGSSKQDQLHDKAALHLGYAHGLLGGEHQCSHGVGTSGHSHYCHGHNEGLKECGMGRMAPTSGF